MEIESRLLVGVNVSDAPNDKGQLGPRLAAVRPVIESLEAVLVDSGDYGTAAVAAVEQPSEATAGPMIYAATGRKSHGRTVQELEQRTDPSAPGPSASAKGRMSIALRQSRDANLTPCANKPLSRFSGSSKRPSDSGASACAASRICAGNGRW